MDTKWTELALKTWYQPDNPLYSNQLHPALGLAGEGGELLDLWKKNEFKPDWSMWNCKHCGFTSEEYLAQFFPDLFDCKKHTPIILDELGDYTYYLRILFHLEKLDYPEPYNLQIEPLDALIGMAQAAMFNLISVRNTGHSFGLHLYSAYRHLMIFCELMEIDLEQVLDINWNKLKDGNNHGWKEAR